MHEKTNPHSANPQSSETPLAKADLSRRLTAPESDEDGSRPTLGPLLAKQTPSSAALVPKVGQVPTINSQPTTTNLPAPPRKIRRNGRVACLPKVQRYMVNRMLWNGVP